MVFFNPLRSVKRGRGVNPGKKGAKKKITKGEEAVEIERGKHNIASILQSKKCRVEAAN